MISCCWLLGRRKSTLFGPFYQFSRTLGVVECQVRFVFSSFNKEIGA